MASWLIERCCLVYLLLGLIPNLTLARPPQQENAAMMMVFCGRELLAVIDEICSASKSYSILDPFNVNQLNLSDDSTLFEQIQRPNVVTKRDSLLRQCCVIGCTEDDLNSFCHTDRDRIVEAVNQQRNEELTIDWLYEFLPRYGVILPPE